MRLWLARLAIVTVGAGVGCASGKTEPPASAPRPTAGAQQAGGAEAPRPAQTRRPPPPPNWERQDSVRKALMAEVLASVAGRENEPAGKVFKNVKANRDMPVKEFLVMMDEQYGRSVSATCTGCHQSANVGGVLKVDWASEQPKKKHIARKMELMTQAINKDLKKNTELDDDYPKATCVMCHRGAEHMPNTMNQLKNSDPPPPTRKKG